MFQIKVRGTFRWRWKEKALSVLSDIATSVGSLPNLAFFVMAMLLKVLRKKVIEARLLLKI